MLNNYEFLRNFIWSLYFYFRPFSTSISESHKFYFLSKLICLHLSSNSSHVRNSKSYNFRSRRCLINHLVKSPHEETEAQKGEVISQGCRDAQRQRQPWNIGFLVCFPLNSVEWKNFVRVAGEVTTTITFSFLFARFACVRLFISFQIPYLQLWSCHWVNNGA